MLCLCGCLCGEDRVSGGVLLEVGAKEVAPGAVRGRQSGQDLAVARVCAGLRFPPRHRVTKVVGGDAMRCRVPEEEISLPSRTAVVEDAWRVEASAIVSGAASTSATSLRACSFSASSSCPLLNSSLVAISGGVPIGRRVVIDIEHRRQGLSIIGHTDM